MRNLSTAPPGLFVIYKGERVPVTNMMDANNHDVPFPDQAVKVVAGPMRDGQWLATTVRPGDIQRGTV